MTLLTEATLAQKIPPNALSGTVKWFNNAKGYGFVLGKDGGSDIFVHFSVIVMDGYKTLVEGQPVHYLSAETKKGRLATSVWPDQP